MICPRKFQQVPLEMFQELNEILQSYQHPWNGQIDHVPMSCSGLCYRPSMDSEPFNGNAVSEDPKKQIVYL